MVQISRSMLVALLLVTVLIFGSTQASGHGNNGFGLGMTSGGSFGGSGGHGGGRTSQDSGGASNTIPRRDGYGVTVSKLVPIEIAKKQNQTSYN